MSADMNQNYHLTVAIPTYRRLAYLKELLPSMVIQCEAAQGRIELLVVDNSSNDGSEEYIREIFRMHRHCRYIKNDVNIGGDLNFARCVELALGQYVWLFGDDEILEDGAFLSLDRYLDIANPKIAIINKRVCRSRVFQNFPLAFNRLIRTDPLFTIHSTLITSLIFKRDQFDFPEDLAKINTCYGHVYALLKTLADRNASFAVIGRDRPSFSIRKVRAAFAETPNNLERKLIDLNTAIAKQCRIPLLRYLYIYYFYIFCPLRNKIKPKMNGMIKTIKKIKGFLKSYS
jgi:glycosyltransferase involved in cell wall biosynthesis